ncbi:MAG: PQQ-binding-like beta-propeller repeat protein [Propionibacteriaceae bacterium]|nr:PQQ-binding-like beta-propeller repeat protein [Propionibacteriaceae bacterium]
MAHRAVLRALRLVCAQLLLFAALTACSSAAPPESAPPPEDRVEPAWETTGAYLSEGSIHGDRLLTAAPGAESGRIDLVGLDLATGGEVWRYGWSPNGGSSRAARWTVIENGEEAYVVFFEDRGEEWTEYVPQQSLISVRVSDGLRTMIELQGFASGSATSCGPEDTRVCHTILDKDGAWTWLDVDPSTGHVERRALLQGSALLLGGFGVTLGHYGGPAEHERVVLIEEGKTIWMFDSQRVLGRTVKNGGAFWMHHSGEDEDPLLLWGELGADDDFGAARLTAVSPTVGDVLWQRDGIRACTDSLNPDDEGLIRACEGSGRVGDPGARYAFVLLDPRTGETVRSYDLDPPAEVNAELGSGRSAELDDRQELVTVDGEEQVLDTRTGERTPFERADRMCWERVEAAHHGSPETPLWFGYRTVPCEGEDTDRTLTKSEVEEWAGDAGWVTLLRGDKIYGYRR